MEHDEFIGLVQARARLHSRGAAERATRVTLEVLGERLGGGEPGDAAAQLPPEIGLHLERGEGSTASFDLGAFYQRVADGTGADLPDAVHHARAVMSVVREAISGGEFDDIVEQLPSDHADLFGFEPADDG